MLLGVQVRHRKSSMFLLVTLKDETAKTEAPCDCRCKIPRPPPAQSPKPRVDVSNGKYHVLAELNT